MAAANEMTFSAIWLLGMALLSLLLLAAVVAGVVGMIGLPRRGGARRAAGPDALAQLRAEVERLREEVEGLKRRLAAAPAEPHATGISAGHPPGDQP